MKPLSVGQSEVNSLYSIYALADTRILYSAVP